MDLVHGILLWPVDPLSPQTVFLNVWSEIERITKESNYIELEFSVCFTYGHRNTRLGCLNCGIVISSAVSNDCAFKVVVRVNGFWEVEGGTQDKTSLWSLCQSWIHGITPHTPFPPSSAFWGYRHAPPHPAVNITVTTWCRVLWFLLCVWGGGVCAYGREVTSAPERTMCMYVGVHM